MRGTRRVQLQEKWRAAPIRSCSLIVLAVLLSLTWLCRVARADQAATALYVRTDSDQTTVISPRARAQKRLGESTQVDVTYAADIWTSASIDIRTSASVRPVTEQRDEIDVGLSQAWEDVHVRSAYRFSTEHDYTSHGVTLGAGVDLAQNAATLDLNLHAIGDTVGQSGNPSFARALTTLDASLTFTQVLDPHMFVQLTYEVAHNRGYQASPYRYVGAGGTGAGCLDASLCLPERVPGLRTRHAFALLARRAFTDALSLGLNYRYYFDDWSLGSHTALIDMGINVAEHMLLALRYRFYTQAAVSFYQMRYASLGTDQYRTRDRELSDMTYHRVGAELERSFPVGDGKLAVTLSLSGNFYNYAAFVGLDTISALELSLGFLLEI